MKRYIFLLFILLCTLGMKAQYVRVVAPKHVSVGEEFQVEYTVYTQDVAGPYTFSSPLDNLPN